MHARTLLVGAWILTLAASLGCGSSGGVTDPGDGDGGGSGTPDNAAPSVSIQAPADGARAVENTQVAFRAAGTDPEDGTLSGSSLTWSSDRDGALGSGAEVRTAALSPGLHRITCRAIDAGGLDATDVIAFTVDYGVAVPAAAGDLVITEIMVNPAGVADSSGEWFEVINPGPRALDLSGLVLRDDDGQQVTVAAGAPTVPAGGYYVFGIDADDTTNGGNPEVDYDYPGSFQLANSADEIVLEVGGVEIDAVRFDTADGWIVPAGAAMQLDPGSTTHARNDDPANWCDATTPYGPDDAGTPGQLNDACP